MDQKCKVKNCKKIESFHGYCSYHYIVYRCQQLKRKHQKELDEILDISEDIATEELLEPLAEEIERTLSEQEMIDVLKQLNR